MIFVLWILISANYATSTKNASKLENENMANEKFVQAGMAENTITVDQNPTITSTTIFADMIDLLVEQKNTAGSWNLVSLIDEQIIYNGVAGGLAGIGIQLLDAREAGVSFVNSTMDAILIDLAQEIARQLEANALEINGTNAIWTVSDTQNVIDPGFDFGLSGISYFYSRLYNQTLNNDFKVLAEKTLQSINDLVNATDGLQFKSPINPLLSNLYWYNPLDFAFLMGLGEITYSGIALGTAGVAKSALGYLQYTDDSTNPLAQNLINQSIQYLFDQKITNGSQISISVVKELQDLKATNYANGMVGIADLYLDLFEFTGNQTYKNEIDKIVNWLNGTIDDTQRMFISNEFNGTALPGFELGLTHGFAGVSKFFLKYYYLTGNQTYLTFAKNIMNFMNPFSIEDLTSNQIHYPERIISGIVRQIRSNSRMFGTTGIYEVLYQLWQELGTDLLKQSVVRTKNFLLSEIADQNGKNGMITYISGKIENSPSLGLPSFLPMLTLRSAGKLLVEIDGIAFDDTEIGNISDLEIDLVNSGESSIDVNLSFLTGDVFSIASSTISLGDQETLPIVIAFTPDNEQEYTDELTIEEVGADQFVVPLTGLGFDFPTLNIIPSLANNTVIDDNRKVTFDIEVIDSSIIGSVNVQIDGSGLQISPTTPGGNDYQFQWITSSTSNGTHTLIFSATDISGFQSQMLFQYTVVRKTTSIEEKVFSQQNLIILGSIIILLVITAVIVTRKYMN